MYMDVPRRVLPARRGQFNFLNFHEEWNKQIMLFKFHTLLIGRFVSRDTGL